MAIKKNEVNLGVTTITNYLNEGYTWLKKDDLGYGSIQELYKANEKQIETIRKHPAFKDADTCITIFNIIDDRKDAATTDTIKSNATTDKVVEQPTMVLESSASEMDAFANL